MKIKYLAITLVLFVVSCKEQEARRPITASKTQTLASTAEQLKKINNIEEAKVQNYIERDSLSEYKATANGFWYCYLNKNDETQVKPKEGDEVEILLEIFDLNNQIIYSKEALGIRNYKVDKEDFIPAIQQGIKMMKTGETIKFVIPSYHAYGIVGDGNKIGVNQSIVSIVTLINIK